MSVALERRLALEAEADRLEALYVQIRKMARRERVGFLDAGLHAVARGTVTLADWDLLRDAHGGRKGPLPSS